MIILFLGKPGSYKITITGNKKTIETSKFRLMNPILSVSFANNLTQTVSVSLIHFKNITLPIQPIIQLNYYQNQTTTKQKEIIIKVNNHQNLINF